MKNFDGMTSEEIREWAEQQRAESRRRFAGTPEPHVDPGKAGEYQDYYGVPRAFRVAPGLRTQVVKQRSGETVLSRVRGMRDVAGGGPNVVLLELDSGEMWAVRRADKPGDWDPDPETFAVIVEHATVPVEAWHVDRAADESATIAAPTRTESWTVRTASLGIE